MKQINLVDASLDTLRRALSTRSITSVELVVKYLQRIARYDCNGPSLNSVCIINPAVLEEAQCSDDYRAAGHKERPLEGIPFLVKDSFCVKGMTVAAGSPAFEDLISPHDATVVASLRKAGAVILGRTNMPPMADGGCQRGLYGRAESPFNKDYLTSAFASGSSSGSGTAIGAAFAAFGFGGETVSSGRSPASNNALVAYSPSRGIIPSGGTWPLYPTCDVLIPFTRTVGDLFDVLNVIVNDSNEDGLAEFWRLQTHVHIPKASEIRPRDYRSLANCEALKGLRIGVPKQFLGIPSGSNPPNFVAGSVLELWEKAQDDLQTWGASVSETNFPLIEEYSKQTYPGQSCNIPGLPQNWPALERLQIISWIWDDFLREINSEKIPNLAAVQEELIHPLVAPMDDPTQYTEPSNHIRYAEMISCARNRPVGSSIFDLPGCGQALTALENMRRQYFEHWLDEVGLDVLIFPTVGDVGRADAEENETSMWEALREGVKYANGGRALKHLGIPAITVPMGSMKDKGMPVGLTFIGKAYADNDLLRYAYAFEQATLRREIPPLCPALPSDVINIQNSSSENLVLDAFSLTLDEFNVTRHEEQNGIFFQINSRGKIQSSASVDSSTVTFVSVIVDGVEQKDVLVKNGIWSWKGGISKTITASRFKTAAKVPKDQSMVIFLGKHVNARTSAILRLLG